MTSYGKYEMAEWLAKNQIMYEIEYIDFNKTVVIKFIDKKNNCVLVERDFPMSLLEVKSVDKMEMLRRLVASFQIAMVNPILFDKPEKPSSRLIRSD